MSKLINSYTTRLTAYLSIGTSPTTATCGLCSKLTRDISTVYDSGKRNKHINIYNGQIFGTCQFFRGALVTTATLKKMLDGM